MPRVTVGNKTADKLAAEKLLHWDEATSKAVIRCGSTVPGAKPQFIALEALVGLTDIAVRLAEKKVDPAGAVRSQIRDLVQSKMTDAEILAMIAKMRTAEPVSGNDLTLPGTNATGTAPEGDTPSTGDTEPAP